MATRPKGISLGRRRQTSNSGEPVTGAREEILAAAMEEFAERGLSGSRVDKIADRTRTSKRMIYYHFHSKVGLYSAVLERAYAQIRSLESEVAIEQLEPAEAMRRIVELTFDYDESNPQFISLVSIENIHKAETLTTLPAIRQQNASVIAVLQRILARGQATGVFRRDVVALDLHLMMSALCFFRVSNRFTFSAVFDCNLSAPATRKRHRLMFADMVLSYLQSPST
jgi:AcrR family transcriptional regulator